MTRAQLRGFAALLLVVAVAILGFAFVLGCAKAILPCAAGYKRSALTTLPLNVVFSGLMVMFLPTQAEKFLPNALLSVIAFVLLQTTPFVLFLKYRIAFLRAGPPSRAKVSSSMRSITALTGAFKSVAARKREPYKSS
jgi:hypothetical protein